VKNVVGRLMGIEPTNVGATIRCVNHFATTAMMFFAIYSLPISHKDVKHYFVKATR
jgi:hypothetical protein